MIHWSALLNFRLVEHLRNFDYEAKVDAARLTALEAEERGRRGGPGAGTAEAAAEVPLPEPVVRALETQVARERLEKTRTLVIQETCALKQTGERRLRGVEKGGVWGGLPGISGAGWCRGKRHFLSHLAHLEPPPWLWEGSSEPPKLRCRCSQVLVIFPWVSM